MTFNITVMENLKPYVCWQVKINGKNALKVTIGGLMNLINATDQFMILGIRLISFFSLLILPRNISCKDKFLKFILFFKTFQAQTTRILTFLHTDFPQFLQEISKVTFNVLMYPTSVSRTKWYCNYLVKFPSWGFFHRNIKQCYFFKFFIKSLDCQATDHHPIPEQQ